MTIATLPIEIKFKKLREGALVPTYATGGSAAFDFYLPLGDPAVTVDVNRQQVVGTGIAVEIPHGLQMLLFPRSGTAAKAGIDLANCVGVIDSDYRGEVCGLVRHNAAGSVTPTFSVAPGERFMQGQLFPVYKARFTQVEHDLSPTERWLGGFGSTGR